MEKDLIVGVCAYKGLLVFLAPEDDSPFEHPNWTCVVGERPMCSIRDTKRHLGISEEAAKILRQLGDQKDDASVSSSSEIGWSETDGVTSFSWTGFPMAIMGMPVKVAAGYRFREGEYVTIKNVVDPQAASVIDAMMHRNQAAEDSCGADRFESDDE